MQPASRHNHRTTISVVSRIRYVLKQRRKINTAPGVQGVIALQDVFAPIVLCAIPQQKSQAAERQVFSMILGQPIHCHGKADAIVLPSPTRSRDVDAG